MTRVLVALMALLCLTVDRAEAQRQRQPRVSAELAEVCTNILSVSQANAIYKQSAPLRSGGITSPIVGFRREPTLIMNSNNSSRRTTRIYASNGSIVATCPWATAIGHPGGRFRCTVQTALLRRAAIRRTESAKIYFQLRGTTCVEVNDAGRCQGSVKGLCNQLIR